MMVTESTESARKEIKRQVLVTLCFINVALAFSFALPTAGMINHLLPFGKPLFWRGLLIWSLLSLLCLGLSLAWVPWLRRRISARLQRQQPVTPETDQVN